MLTVSRIHTNFALAFNPYQLLKSMLCYVKSIISHLKIMHSLVLCLESTTHNFSLNGSICTLGLCTVL